MLKLQFKDRRQEAVWLVDQVFSIGSNSRNSLVAKDQGIADYHAEIVNQGSSLSLKNKTGKASIWVNDLVVKEAQTIVSGDRIKLGSLELELIDPKETEVATASKGNPQTDWAISSNASWLEQNRYVINGRAIIGRDNTCDIQLPIEHLSRQHAQLEVRNGQLYVKDLGSSNGTYLNGNRVTESPVKTGDKLKFDVVTFDIEGPKFDPNKTIIRTLDAPGVASSKNAATTKGRASRQPAPAEAKKKPERKLAAQGKQDWIKTEAKNTESEKSGKAWIVASAILIACIVGYFAVY